MAAWITGCVAGVLLTGAMVPMGLDDATETSTTFAYATYKEQRGAVTVLVDTLPASFRDDEPYIPVPVAIGFQDYGRGLTISPEIFVLVDQAGRSYAAASYEEIARDYTQLEFDAGFVAGRPITAQQFVVSRRLPSSFYPPPGLGTRVPRVHLDAYTWFRDVIYFPHPDAGLGGVLTLRLHGGGFDPPLEVRVRIPLPGIPIR